MAFVHHGIYLVKNEEPFQKNEWNRESQKYEKSPWEFKTKTTHPLLCVCKIESHGPYYTTPAYGIVRMHILNPYSQFANKTDKCPHMQLTVNVCRGEISGNRKDFTEEDFMYCGTETDVQYQWYPIKNATEIFKRWEENVIQNGWFTPQLNPSYKTKAEKQRNTAKDFFGNTVKVGDKVAYVCLSGYRYISTGSVTNITDQSIVVDNHYAAPYEYVIKCPAGF